MRFLSLVLSIILHTGIVGLGVVWVGQQSALKIDLSVPVYHIDLVKLPGIKGDKAVKKAKEEKKAAPVKAKPEPKPEPPKPKKVEAKPISAKKDTPKKPEAKDDKAKKEKEKKKAKPKPSPEEVLAKALKEAQSKAKKKADQERKMLADELAALQQTVEEEDAASPEGEGDVTAGGEGGVDLETVYVHIVKELIKENWRFPIVGGRSRLKASVRIRLDGDGRIVDYFLVASSGRPDFDASTLKAVADTEEVPPPPAPRFEEIVINFNQQELGEQQ